MTWLLQEVQRQERRQHWYDIWQRRRILTPGLVFASALALCAFGLQELESYLMGYRIIEAIAIAMILGVVARNLTNLPDTILPGATYASKTLLELAVILLGLSIDVTEFADAGLLLLVTITIGVLVGMVMSFILGKIFGLKSRLSYLIAVGNSICGNSAIAAVAPVLKATREEIASAIGLTAAAGVVMVILLPALVPVMRLNDYQYGIIAGMAIYAVPQVVAAGFSVSQLSGEIATVVKLVRVMFLGPVVLLTSLYVRLHGDRSDTQLKPTLIPWFVIGFLMLLSLRSLGAIPDPLIEPFRDIGRGLTMWAMAGLGLGVEVRLLGKVGARVGATSVLSMSLLVVLSYGLVSILGSRHELP